jgi:hypothetical protein
MVEGFAMFDQLWPASLVRALRSSMASLGLFSGGGSIWFLEQLADLVDQARILVARRLSRLGLGRHRLLGRRLQAERRLGRGLRPGGAGAGRQHRHAKAEARELRPEEIEEMSGSIGHIAKRSLTVEPGKEPG